MNILFITNYYPPCNYDWGYMQLCEEVVERLACRGHRVAVLTSTYRHGLEPQRAYPVFRWLPIDPDWHSKRPAFQQFIWGRHAREETAVGALNRAVDRTEAQVVFAWHCIGLPRRLLESAERLERVAMAYYLANYLPELPDEYLRYWQTPASGLLAKPIKRLTALVATKMLRHEGKPIHLAFPNSICVSDYLRERLLAQRLIAESAVTIHNGIDLQKFSRVNPTSFSPSTPIRCIIAGRVDWEKGIHTVVEAFGRLDLDSMQPRFQLTILGDGPAEYAQYVHHLVESNELADKVQVQSPVQREEMPAKLAAHDVFIVASEYAEPLARAGQEAMGMGLLVVGTVTGGSGELLVHQQTGLVFDAGDPASLAAQLRYIAENPLQAEQLAEAGRQSVVDHFNIDRTVQEIEQHLVKLVSRKEA